MAIARVRKFTEIYEVETFLNGGIILGDVEKSGIGALPSGLSAGIDNLVGKTLHFTTPNVTITFTAASPASPNQNPNVLLFKDIKAQIEAQAAALKVRSFGKKLVIMEATPTNGLVLADDGTANPLLGFKGPITTKVYAAPPSAVAPCWTFATVDPSNGQHVIYTFE